MVFERRIKAKAITEWNSIQEVISPLSSGPPAFQLSLQFCPSLFAAETILARYYPLHPPLPLCSFLSCLHYPLMYSKALPSSLPCVCGSEGFPAWGSADSSISVCAELPASMDWLTYWPEWGSLAQSFMHCSMENQ